MRNFLRIAQGITVTPILLALYRHQDLWGVDKIRQQYSEESPHKDVDDILVRFSVDEPVGDCLQCDWTAAANVIPAIRDMALAVMSSVKGEQLGRVMVTRLPPGKAITPHRDVLGKYANFYTRYHVPLQSDVGCVFSCGEENVHMQAGEVWWFNGHLDHAVTNNSARDRLNLIIDAHLCD